jgi:hypothetical protein
MLLQASGSDQLQNGRTKELRDGRTRNGMHVLGGTLLAARHYRLPSPVLPPDLWYTISLCPTESNDSGARLLFRRRMHATWAGQGSPGHVCRLARLDQSAGYRQCVSTI